MACLAAAGADLLAFETIPSIKEAQAVAELLREFPDSAAWLAFSCKVSRLFVCAAWERMEVLIDSNKRRCSLCTGREVHFRRQPLHRRREGGQQVPTAAGRGRELLLAGAGGAAAGLCWVPPEPRPELGGLPQQWRGVGQGAGVSLSSQLSQF